MLTFSSHGAPTGRSREEAVVELAQRIKEKASRVQHVPEEEQESALNEALNHVRGGRP